MRKFFNELKQRNVVKEGLAYLVISWMILQVGAIISPLLGAPPWVMRSLLFLLIIGFPIWMIIAWMYEITPDGLKRNASVKQEEKSVVQRGNRLNIVIIGALAIAVVLLLLDRFDVLGRTNGINKTEISSEISKKSVAVLPFENMSKDEGSEFFSDGVMEDILIDLAHFKDLKVISKTSSMHYKGTTKKIPEIAKELGVAYILEGSVRKYENNVRIVAQLIDASEDAYVWANNFDRELAIQDIFSIQSEVALKIAQALKLNISNEEKTALRVTPTNSADAYQMMLKGRSLADLRTEEGLSQSIQILESALNLDPNYVDAISELANSTWLHGYYNFSDAETAYEKAELLAKKALIINPKNERAFSVLGNVYSRTNRSQEGSKAFEDALALNPSDAITHHHYSIYFDNQGNTEKAFYHSEKSLEFDPLSLSINYHYLSLLMASNRLDEAKTHLKKMDILFDNAEDKFARYYGSLFMAEEKYAEAIPYFEKEEALSKSVQGELGYCYAKLGDSQKAKEYLAQIPSNIYDLNAAIIHFALQEQDSAYIYLNACLDKNIHLGFILNDPVFNPYRQDERFTKIIKEIEVNQIEN